MALRFAFETGYCWQFLPREPVSLFLPKNRFHYYIPNNQFPYSRPKNRSGFGLIRGGALLLSTSGAPLPRTYCFLVLLSCIFLVTTLPCVITVCTCVRNSSLQVLYDMRVLTKLDSPLSSGSTGGGQGGARAPNHLPYAHEDVRRASREGEDLNS